MNVIVFGMMVCLGLLIICAAVLKIMTDKIIRDYELRNRELEKRLRQWAEYSYKQSDKIEELERKLKNKERV